MQTQSKVIGLEHTRVLVALNIANELLSKTSQGAADDDALVRVRELRDRVQSVTRSQEPGY